MFKFRRSSERSVVRSVVLALVSTLLVPVFTVLAPIAPANAAPAPTLTAANYTTTFVGAPIDGSGNGQLFWDGLAANTQPVGYNFCNNDTATVSVSAAFAWETASASIGLAGGSPDTQTLSTALAPGSCSSVFWFVTSSDSIGASATMKFTFTVVNVADASDSITITASKGLKITVTNMTKSANLVLDTITVTSGCASLNETCTMTVKLHSTSGRNGFIVAPLLNPAKYVIDSVTVSEDVAPFASANATYLATSNYSDKVTAVFVLRSLTSSPIGFKTYIIGVDNASTFNDWGATESFGNALVAASGLTNVTVAYAKNTSDAVSGMPSPLAESATAGTTYTVKAAPSRTGYDFVGWESGTVYSAGDTFTVPSSDVTLNATWSPKQFSVTYDSNTATSGTEPTSDTATYGATYTTKTNAGSLAKSGYTFGGWNRAADGGGANYTAGSSFTFDYATSDTLTLYAKWTAIPPAPSGGGGSPVMYNLTTEVIGTGSLSPSSGSYTSGSSVTVIATAGRNQVFNSWAGDCSGTTPSCTLTMNGDRTARAIFMPSAYDLTVSATGEGIVAPASGTYTPGAVVQLAAQPSTGWQFSNWTGACSGTATTCSVTMSSDKSVNAVFTRITPASNTTLAKYALDVKVTGSGVVQVSPSQPVGGYSDGTVVQLTASPRTGWSLSAWGGACTGADLFCSITMNAAKSVTATFKATSLPDIVSAAWVQPQPNGTTLASWEAASGATQYVIELGGKKLQTVTGTTATLNRLIGPNDVVKIRSVNPAGTTEPSEPATFIASTVALQLFTVNFSAGSATLTAKAKTALNAAIRQIRASGYTSLSVVGHTDNTERNALALSVARARAVTAFVGNTLTLTFVTSGKGATSPLTSNSTAAGRAANRRAVGTVK